MFPHELLAADEINVRVFDLRIREEGGYELTVSYFQTPDGEQWPMVGFLAFKHHMRWLKHCPGIPTPAKREWGLSPKPHLHVFTVEGWQVKRRLSVDEGETSGLQQCRLFHLLAKTDLTPEGIYGRCLRGSSIFGHAEESGSEWHIGGHDADFPILNRNWGINGGAGQDDRAFLLAADIPFSIGSAQQVVRAGSKLVEKYDDVEIAARHVQEIHMGYMAPMAPHPGILLRKHPELGGWGGGIAQLREIGALPHYGGAPPGASRPSGLPYDDSKPHLMVGEIWKDVRKGRVLAVHADASKPDAPLIPTPTTAALENCQIALYPPTSE